MSSKNFTSALEKTCVVAVYESIDRARQAVHILERAEFPMSQVSMITRGDLKKHAVELPSPPTDDSVRDAAVGAGLGALLGVLSGLAAAAVSGIGVVFIVGPAAGFLAGATSGAFLGGLGGWGVHKHRIDHYRHQLEKGRTIVVVTGETHELAHADRILQETQPVELHLYGASESESPEVAVD